MAELVYAADLKSVASRLEGSSPSSPTTGKEQTTTMPKTTKLSASDSLRNIQSYIWQMNIDRGFNTSDASKKLVLLMEEMGELAKAVRKIAGLKFTNTTKRTNLKEELADVQIVLLGLASLLEVDMYEALLEKEDKNNKREWN